MPRSARIAKAEKIKQEYKETIEICENVQAILCKQFLNNTLTSEKFYNETKSNGLELKYFNEKILELKPESKRLGSKKTISIRSKIIYNEKVSRLRGLQTIKLQKITELLCDIKKELKEAASINHEIEELKARKTVLDHILKETI